MTQQHFVDPDSVIPDLTAMSVEDRARAIRDDLLARPGEEWVKTLVGGIVVPTFESREFSAVLWNEYHLEMLDTAATVRPRNAVMASRLYPPYTLDVWVKGDRVLSMSWSGSDQITMIDMSPGDWEARHFALPPLAEPCRQTIH